MMSTGVPVSRNEFLWQQRPIHDLAVACLSIALLATVAMPEASANEPGPIWCRIDDPAATETRRQQEKISNSQVDAALTCPDVAAAITLPDELVLPMPCGRRMVFRSVSFRLDHILDHAEAHLGMIVSNGQENPVMATMNGPWTARISGGFSRDIGEAIERVFYIGKYEVTEAQYALFRAGAFESDAACDVASEAWKSVSGTRVLPATGIHWVDAVGFGDAYSRWLLRESANAVTSGGEPLVPWEAAAPGFVRLPTEAEWEFSARGGQVSVGSQSATTYDILRPDGQIVPGTITDIANLSDASNPTPSNSSVFYVGRKAPNLLGIHDIVGNADEIMLEPFRPLRPDEFAGQVGGVVVRGGNASEPASIVGVGYRREVPLYGLDGPVRGASTGFRLVLSAPVFMDKRGPDWKPLVGNPDLNQELAKALSLVGDNPDADVPGATGTRVAEEELESLRQEYERTQARNAELVDRLKALEEASTTSSNAEATSSSVLAELRADAARAAAEADAMRSRMTGIQTQLSAASAEVRERTRQVRREQIRSAILTVNAINTTNRMLQVFERQVQALEDRRTSEPPEVRAQIDQALQDARPRAALLADSIRAQYGFYLDVVFTLSKSGPEIIEDGFDAVRFDLRAKGIVTLDDATDLTHKHVMTAVQAGGPVPEAVSSPWLSEIYAVQRTR